MHVANEKMAKTNSDIRILVVDDDPDILFTTVRILKKEGYEVTDTKTGYECLEKVKANSPDLILLDVHLPDIPGTEVCVKIKKNHDQPKKYILMMSGIKTSSDDQADGLDAGADEYITRPISNRELLSRVNSVVRLIRAERKNILYISELKQTLESLNELRGIVPICMHCKGIRDDKGYWNKVEEFISNHSGTQFDYCICDSCLKQHSADEQS